MFPRALTTQLIVLIALLSLGGPTACGPADAPSEATTQRPGQAEREKAIAARFDEYRQALRDGDGSAAAECVDSTTLDWYDRALRDALEASPEEVALRDTMHKFTVLRLRLELSTDELKAMSGRDLFAHSVEHGWVDRSSVESLDSLVDIAYITEQRASASVPGAGGHPVFHFSKEKGEWRLALARLFPTAEAVMEQAREASGKSEELFLIQALSALSPNRVDAEVYERLLQGPLR